MILFFQLFYLILFYYFLYNIHTFLTFQISNPSNASSYYCIIPHRHFLSSLHISTKKLSASYFSNGKNKRQTFQIRNLCLFNTHLISYMHTSIWAVILFPILTPAQEQVRNTKQSPLKTIY